MNGKRQEREKGKGEFKGGKEEWIDLGEGWKGKEVVKGRETG